VGERSLERSLVLIPLIHHPVDIANSAPGLGESEIVSELLEPEECPFRDPAELVDAALGIGERAKEGPLELRMELDAMVLGGGSNLNGLGQDLIGLGELPGEDECGAQLAEELFAPGHIRCEECLRAAEEVGRCGNVPSHDGAPPSSGEALSRLRREIASTLIARAELAPITEGLFEVIAEDLFNLDRALGTLVFDPEGEALVQLGTNPLRKPSVGGVTDEEMAKAVGLLAGHH
jgi:hypothetical protein